MSYYVILISQAGTKRFTPHRSYGLNRRTCPRGKYGFCSDFIDIINAMGGTAVEYKYDAWGNILSVTGSMANTLGAVNPFRYRSYYYDTESGFYYLQSRYYDPQVGRFLNADGIIGANGGIMGYNMFAYCNNNPVMYVDENRASATVDTGVVVGGILGFILYHIDLSYRRICRTLFYHCRRIFVSYCRPLLGSGSRELSPNRHLWRDSSRGGLRGHL